MTRVMVGPRKQSRAHLHVSSLHFSSALGFASKEQRHLLSSDSSQRTQVYRGRSGTSGVRQSVFARLLVPNWQFTCGDVAKVASGVINYCEGRFGSHFLPLAATRCLPLHPCQLSYVRRCTRYNPSQLVGVRWLGHWTFNRSARLELVRANDPRETYRRETAT